MSHTFTIGLQKQKNKKRQKDKSILINPRLSILLLCNQLQIQNKQQFNSKFRILYDEHDPYIHKYSSIYKLTPLHSWSNSN